MEFSLISIFENILSYSGSIKLEGDRYLFIVRVESQNKEIVESLITHVVDGDLVLPLSKQGGKYNEVEEAIKEKYIMNAVM